MSLSSFEPVIGLEIHAQMGTKSKLFCLCSNDSFGVKPNTNVCPICMGFPGMLPVINREAIEKAAFAALSLHLDIPEFSKFDRKNYFYPDLPKGFQISQYDKPLSQKGYVDIIVNGEKKRVRIHRLHVEDDAGKLVHVSDGTLCDYNRSGSPLMEIVSEPDLHSVEEASAYANEIQRILRYCGVSECDMEKGMMRFDINVSLRKKGDTKLGTKTEVKNLNSFRSLESALEFEIKRQAELLDSGQRIVQETRGWDDEKCDTFSQRSKEEAHDYRYFPEPDLPPIMMNEAQITKLRSHIPELPLARRLRFVEQFGISEEDASQLTEERAMADYFENVVAACNDAKTALSFITTILTKHLNRDGLLMSSCKISAAHLGELINTINEGVISNNMAKTEIFEEMYATGKPPRIIIKEKGLEVMSDTIEIEALCKKIIETHAGPAADFKKGKQQVLGFLVGKVMQETGGKANPKTVNEILRKLLA